MVKPSAFLALEASLSLRMSTALEALTSKVYKAAQAAIEDGNWEEAEGLVRGLKLSSVFSENEEYIRYISKVAILFGASRVTSTPGTSAVGLGFESSAIRQWVESFRLGIEYNLQERLIATGLQLIAQAKEKASAPEEKFAIILKADSDYLGSVLKAAKKPSALLPFASFMTAEGSALFNVASSLHTSRLSAFGYTAEAEYLGITTYQINEQLDGRTCPVCSLMHKKTFKVSDARALLDTVIRTQDPDELKSLQPWPSQSSQALAEMSTLTESELVSRGWHVPPFHPRCRGLLSKVGTVPALSALATTTTPAEKYVSTKEDFLQLGINLSNHKIGIWNTLIQTSPAELIANLTGSTSDQLLVESQAPNPQKAIGLSNLTVTRTGVNVELQSTAFGSKHPVVQDYYFRKNQSLYVGLIKLHKDDVGIGKKLLKALFRTAKSTSMKSIQMVADDDISGYAWAKYGFSLSPRQWGLVKAQIKRSVEKMAAVTSASPVEQKAVSLILDSNDPKNIFALADLKLGKALLSDTTWAGTLDFDDAESVTRFIAAMGK